MVQVYYSESDDNIHEITLESQESLLNGLLRHGHDIPHGCKSGVCHACIMESKDPVPAKSRMGLSQSQTGLGHFLSCCCVPQESITVKLNTDVQNRYRARVIKKDQMNKSTWRLQLVTEDTFNYKSGQFVTLFKNDKVSRCYSLASTPASENHIEFHIKSIAEGEFSGSLADDFNEGDELQLMGPNGQCFYTPEKPEQSILLCGLGTGLAPLYGIAKEALAASHTGTIDLVIGAKYASDLYLFEELNTLQQQHPHFHVHYLAQESSSATDTSDEEQSIITADIYEYCQSLISDISEHRIFLCGAESFVKKMKRQCFMSGAKMGNIAADVFLPT